MTDFVLEHCPFCGGAPKPFGDHTIACDCGAAVTHYNYNHDERHVVFEKWNKRSLDIEPLIKRVAKMEGQGSAYTDLCSANYKLNRAKK